MIFLTSFKGALVLIQVLWFHMVSSFPSCLHLRRKSLFRSTGSYQNRSTKLFSTKKCKNSVTNSQSIACKKLTSILLPKQRSTEDTPVLVNNAKSALKNCFSKVFPAGLYFYLYLFLLCGITNCNVIKRGNKSSNQVPY